MKEKIISEAFFSNNKPSRPYQAIISDKTISRLDRTERVRC